MKKNPSYTALLRPSRLLISEKSATYMNKWSYTIIWQVRVHTVLFFYNTYRKNQSQYIFFWLNWKPNFPQTLSFENGLQAKFYFFLIGIRTLDLYTMIVVAAPLRQTTTLLVRLNIFISCNVLLWLKFFSQHTNTNLGMAKFCSFQQLFWSRRKKIPYSFELSKTMNSPYFVNTRWTIVCNWEFTSTDFFIKVEKILKGSLDSISSASVKIQIMGGKVCLRCRGKTLLGVFNKLLKTKSLLTSPSNVLPCYPK